MNEASRTERTDMPPAAVIVHTTSGSIRFASTKDGRFSAGSIGWPTDEPR